MDILLICGGGGSEHDISLLSADFFVEHLKSIENAQFHRVEITPEGDWLKEKGESCLLQRGGILSCSAGEYSLDFAIPCIHGSPGEDGRIQALFELIGLPYLGSGPEASLLAFDKISTKLWAEALGIPTTPFAFIEDTSASAMSTATTCWKRWGEVFVKPSRQGSSVGMAQVFERGELKEKIHQAFQYSPTVLIERSMKGRELELAVYQYKGKLHVSAPGEILCSDGFYDYRQKYSKNSSVRHV